MFMAGMQGVGWQRVLLVVWKVGRSAGMNAFHDGCQAFMPCAD